MNEKQVFKIVQDVIGRKYLIAPQFVQYDTNLVHNFAMDSMDRINIFYLIKNELNCEVPADEEDSFYLEFTSNPTPQTIVKFFCKKLNIPLYKQSNYLYKKSVPELVAIIERQRMEIIKLRQSQTK